MDKYLVSLAFFLLCLECGWLAEDLNWVDLPWLKTSYTSQSGESLGEIKFVKRNVRRKSHSSLVWEDTRDAQNVFAYDSVLTLDQSAAEVNLKSGTVITLHENTLVSIEPLQVGDSDGPVRLRFGRGSLQAHLGREPASFDAGSWVVEAKPQSQITVRAKGKDEYEIESHGGEAKIFGAHTTSVAQVIKSGESISLKQEKVSEPKAVLELDWQTPQDGERIYTHDSTAEVNFSWKSSNSSSQVSEIAVYDPDNDKEDDIAVSENSPDRNQPVKLKTGNYSVQLAGKTQSSFARSISIWSAPKIYLLDPLPRQRIRSGKPLVLSWTLNSEVSNYLWQIASDENFKNIVEKGETPQSFVEVKNLAVGQYYWRVRGQDEQGFIIPEIYFNPFTIVSKPLEAPKLKSPHIFRDEESLLFKIWNWIIPQAVGDELPAHPKLPKHYKAEFQWERVKGAAGYTIEMSETSDFRSIVLTTKTEHPKFVWRNFKLGNYYWRVAAVSPDGEVGLFSEVAGADLTSIPHGTITPEGVVVTPITKLDITPHPTPIPAPSVSPAPVSTPPPEEPIYRAYSYSVELGAHYVYEYFKGSDFTATESGPYVGDARFSMTSPFDNFKAWRGELEFQHVVVKTTNAGAFPFQGSGVDYGVDLTVFKQTPFLSEHSWGFSVLNEYAVYQRAALEDLTISFPILAGPVIDWRHNYETHETHYRLGAYLGAALAAEARASYIYLIPMGENLTTTLTFEGRGVGGISTGGSYFGLATGMFYLGVRW